MASLFEQIGAQRLRTLLVDFYERLTSDVMIGFLFFGKDKARLVDKEWEFAAKLLGGDLPYTGRPIREAHSKSPILGGHFDRRTQILRETLADHDVPETVSQTWLAHTEKLRALVTADSGSECDHDRAMMRLAGPDDSGD